MFMETTRIGVRKNDFVVFDYRISIHSIFGFDGLAVISEVDVKFVIIQYPAYHCIVFVFLLNSMVTYLQNAGSQIDRIGIICLFIKENYDCTA